MRCSDYTWLYFSSLAFNFIFSEWYNMLKSYLFLINLICKISTNRMNIIPLWEFFYAKEKEQLKNPQSYYPTTATLCTLVYFFWWFSYTCFCKHSYTAIFYTSLYPVFKMHCFAAIFLIAIYLCGYPFNDYRIFHWVAIKHLLNYFVIIGTLDYFQIFTITVTLQWTSSWK